MPPRARACLEKLLHRLPGLEGPPIRVRFQSGLWVVGNHLEPGANRGIEVLAASSLGEREVVLELELLRRHRELARIFVHELFHFVWRRLSNQLRWSFVELLSAEMLAHAKGELGWSAESKKLELTAGDRDRRTRNWREYTAESFCDTAAWFLAPANHHEEYTLRPRFRARRARWFCNFLAGGHRIAM